MKLVEGSQATYLLGTVIVWIGLFAATAVTLGGTSHFGEMVPILCVGAVYFTVIAPLSIWPSRAQPREPNGGPANGDRGTTGQPAARIRKRLHLFGLLGLIGLLGIPLDQPILFLFYLFFALFAFTPPRHAHTPPRP